MSQSSLIDLPSSDLGNPDKRLVVSPGLEIENADKLTPLYFQHLNIFFREQCKIEPSINDCNTLYLDTPAFDLLRSGFLSGMSEAEAKGSGLTLRDRPGGQASNGEEFEDQYSTKRLHREFTAYASQLTQQQYPNQIIPLEHMPYVRTENEYTHSHPRDVSEYRLRDLPEETQGVVIKRLGSRAKNLVFKPQLITFVQRTRYSVFLNPSDAYDFILPATFNPEDRKGAGNHVCIEVAMDKCIHKRPPSGMNIKDILDAKQKTPGFHFLRTDLLAEREYKAEKSGENLIDSVLVSAYSRFAMCLYDMSKQRKFRKGDADPIRPVPSKASLGIEARLLSLHSPEEARKLSSLAP